MDFIANNPLYLQVVTDIKKQIITGKLPPGARLPSTRELAAQYKINPNTAVRVYNQLEQEGITFIRRGIGTFVTEQEDIIMEFKSERAESLIRELLEELKSLGVKKEEIIEIIERSYSC